MDGNVSGSVNQSNLPTSPRLRTAGTSTVKGTRISAGWGSSSRRALMS